MKNNMKTILTAILLVSSGLLFSGYTFYEKTPPVRSGGNPVIEFTMSSTVADFFSPNKNNINRMLQDLGRIWFRSTEGSISFQYGGSTAEGTTDRNRMGSISCANDIINKSQPINFSHTADDPDCTAEVCTYVWYCKDNDLKHTESVFNISLVDMNDLAFDLNTLKTIVMHELGHGAGLTHCDVGDNSSRCDSKQTSAGGNPGEGNVMYRFYDSAGITPTSNDVAGIYYLYAHTPSLIPYTGTYGITDEEMDFMLEYRNFFERAGAYTEMGRRSQQSVLIDLGSYYKRKTGLTVMEAANRFYTHAMGQTEHFSIKELKYQRKVLTVALDSLAQLKEDQDNGIRSFDDSFLNRVIQGHIALRQRTIQRIRELGYE